MNPFILKYRKSGNGLFVICFHLLREYEDGNISLCKAATNDHMVIKRGFKAAVPLPLLTYKRVLFMMQFSQESGIQSVIDFCQVI